jgi:hypothetical protein
MLNQELQICKEHLLTLRTKINNSHMELKTKSAPFNNAQAANNFNQTLQSPADQLMQPLNQLYLKEQHQLLANSNLAQMQQQSNNGQNKSKLVELLNYPKQNNSITGNNGPNNNRQFSHQQNSFSSFNNTNMGQNWNNFNL